MIIKLYERSRTGLRTIIFKSWRERGRYLAMEKNKAYANKLQFTFKRNEYLRVYQNSVMFFELDIASPKTKNDPKVEAERLYKQLLVA